jgi:hypothetical protein
MAAPGTAVPPGTTPEAIGPPKEGAPAKKMPSEPPAKEPEKDKGALNNEAPGAAPAQTSTPALEPAPAVQQNVPAEGDNKNNPF